MGLECFPIQHGGKDVHRLPCKTEMRRFTQRCYFMVFQTKEEGNISRTSSGNNYLVGLSYIPIKVYKD